MKHSFSKHQKAILFREWHTSRSWLVGLFILTLIGPLGKFLYGIYQIIQGYSVDRWSFWNVLVPALYGNAISFSQLPPISIFHAASDPLISNSWALVGVLFGMVPWVTDRGMNGITAALTVPIRRLELVLVKCCFSGLILLFIQIMRGVIILYFNAWAGNSFSLRLIAVWWLTNTLCMILAFTAAMFVASIVTSWLQAGLITSCILTLPFLTASILDKGLRHVPTVSFLTLHNLTSSYVHDPLGWLKALSPLKFTGTSSGGGMDQIFIDNGNHYLSMAGFVWVFFALCAILFISLTIRLFNHVPAENMTYFFIYPQMWKWVMGAVSALISYLIAIRLSHGMIFFTQFLIVFLICTLIIYIFFLYLFRRFSH